MIQPPQKRAAEFKFNWKFHPDPTFVIENLTELIYVRQKNPKYIARPSKATITEEFPVTKLYHVVAMHLP